MAFNLLYQNQGATRNLPVSPELARIYEEAAKAAGITGIRVTSGGQEATGPHRTGSHRHDLGGAGDIQLEVNGRILDMSNPEDLPIISNFVSSAKGAGATGIGAGTDYMGNKTFHVGLGNPGIWGAGGKSANAPEWLQKAYGMTLNSNPVTTASADATTTAPADTTTAVPAATTTTEKPATPMDTALSGLGEIASGISNRPASSEASQIIPSSVASTPAIDPTAMASAQQLMSTLLQNRRSRYGMSLMG
jgi:hypothetical protein